MRVIIIGAGAGGASTAARLRRLSEHTEITLIDKREDISQATCGLPYALGNVIKDRSRLVVVEKNEFARLLNVDVRTAAEVTCINPESRTVSIRNLHDGTVYEEHYDKLVLAPGGSAYLPDIPGIRNNNVFTLQNINDLNAIRHHMKGCQHVVIMGAGFIGLEVADNLHDLGVAVSIIEMSGQVLGQMDAEMASLVHQHLKTKNINLVLNNHVTAVTGNTVELHSGQALPAELVIVATGVRPSTALARDAGLALGDKGGIAVDTTMATSCADIYALGDSVEVHDHVLGCKSLVQLAGPAHKQATVVAANLLGDSKRVRALQGTTIAKVFDLTVAMTGATEKQLRSENFNYSKSYVDVPAHAGFYPGAHPITIKLLFNPDDGKVLGAQVVGVNGVDKRIDIISTIIHFNKTVYDLAELDLAYAPPYSSAKDPVNIAGMVARNMLEDNYSVNHWNEVHEFSSDSLILDVRTETEYELDAISGSINIPLDQLRSRLHELPRDRRILVYCQQGKKGYFASRLLMQRGYNEVSNLSGGYKLFRAATGLAAAGVTDSDQGAVTPAAQTRVAISADVEIDAVGMNCPGPIMRLNREIQKANNGQYLLIRASDPGFSNDVETWCRRKGHTLHTMTSEKAVITALIQKKAALAVSS